MRDLSARTPVSDASAQPMTEQTGAHSDRRTLWRRHALILAIYGVLAMLLWWPLPLHLATHVPGVPQWAYDEATFLWNIWAFKDAVVDGLRSPLHSDLIYYPLGIDLILYTYNFFHVLASLPLALATTIPLASNLSLLLSTALSGYGTWVLVRWLLRAEHARGQGALVNWAAFVGGAIFAFASNRSIYAALGHYDMVTTQWIPFYALMLLRSFDAKSTPRARLGAAALAGLFFAFNGLAEMITALFLAIFTLIVVLFLPGDAGASRPRPFILQWRRWLPALAVNGVVAFAVWSPVLLPILLQFLTNDFSLKGWGEAIPLSTDLLGWFTPTTLHPVFGSDLVTELRRVQLRALEESVQGFRDLNTVFIGWVTGTLALAGALLYRRRTRIWWITALVFGIFTLGPFLQINGNYQFDLDGVEAVFPLPYAILHWIPIIKANRAPNRNSVILMLALATLAAFALYWLLNWLATRRRAPVAAPMSVWAAAIPVLLAGAILFEHLVVPMPLTDMRVPAVYQQIATDPRPVSVLQIPLGWRNSFGVLGPEATILQYYQTVHGKPMLGGNISRAPDFKMEYFARLPYFQALTEIEFGREVAPETLDAARAQADELMALYNVGYVLLYPPVANRPPYSDHWQATWDFVRATLPLEAEPFWAQDGIEAYRVLPPALDDAFALDLGAQPSLAYRGEGWENGDLATVHDVSALWATGEERNTSVLFAPLQGVDPAQPFTLRVRAMPFTWEGSPAQSAQLTFNGVAVGEPLPVPADWNDLTWQIPSGVVQDGLNRIELTWAYANAPRAVAGGSRQIGATGVELPIDADLKAFADGGFISLFDAEGTQIDASAGRRGVNLTTLDARTGEVLSMQGFDTTANAFESAALATAIDALPPGALALIASHGDAWAHLTDDAVAGLRSLGLDVTLAELTGNYLAAVGVKGAASGAAAWTLHENDAFLRISLDRDRRLLAAAIDTIELAPAE